MENVWITVFLWVLGGLMSLIVLIGGAYMRKLSNDIERVEVTHSNILAQIQTNCQQEARSFGERSERIAKLEAAYDLMSDDLTYIRKRVDEIAVNLARVNPSGT